MMTGAEPVSFRKSIKGEMHPNQNWACYVRYLKIINTFLKCIMQVSWSKLGNSDTQIYGTNVLEGQAVFELLIKTIFCTFWSINFGLGTGPP